MGSKPRQKQKYESGEASNFMTRKRALKKLQLTLKVSPTQCSGNTYKLSCFFPKFAQ